MKRTLALFLVFYYACGLSLGLLIHLGHEVMHAEFFSAHTHHHHTHGHSSYGHHAHSHIRYSVQGHSSPDGHAHSHIRHAAHDHYPWLEVLPNTPNPDSEALPGVNDLSLWYLFLGAFWENFFILFLAFSFFSGFFSLLVQSWQEPYLQLYSPPPQRLISRDIVLVNFP